MGVSAVVSIVSVGGERGLLLLTSLDDMVGRDDGDVAGDEVFADLQALWGSLAIDSAWDRGVKTERLVNDTV